LSQWELRLNGLTLESLAVATTEPFAALHVGRGAPAAGRADADVVVVRERHICGGMRERLKITNHGSEPVPLLLELFCDVDFADVFEVKESRVRHRGHHGQRIEPNALVFTHHDRGVRREVRLAATGDPHVEPGLIAWRTALAPAATWDLCIEVLNVVNGQEIEDRFRCDTLGPEPLVRRYDAWLAKLPRVDSDRGDLVTAVRRAAEDLGALRIVDPETNLTVPAAGAPWFMTLFGRDSLITSWMALPVDSSLAEGVLQSLARLQGDRVDPATEEAPGRIMHEVRFGAATGLSLGGRDVYYGSVDATPLFVMLLGEVRRWGLHDELVDELLPHADRALAWVEEYGDRDNDGYVEYERASPHGLANQGWKDSWDAIRFADGRLAEPPIALCEVQAYVYGAYVARAHFALEAGDQTMFERYRAKAGELRRRFNEDFWLEDQGTYALGLDADKRPIDAVASNAGHCLWTGIAEPLKAAAVAQRLLAPDMFSGWGIRTLAATMSAYNPVSYHNGSVWPHDNALCAAGLARYGHLDAAHRVIEAQLAVAAGGGGHLPELFAGFDRTVIPVPAAYPASCAPQAWAAASPLLWLRILLGLEPWAFRDRVWIDPSLPPTIGRLRADDIAIGDTVVSIAVDGTSVDVHSDREIRIIRARRAPVAAIIESDAHG
jgi:glycogen debranching enzyme